MDLWVARKKAEKLQKKYPNLSRDEAINKQLERALNDASLVERAHQLREFREDLFWSLIGIIAVGLVAWACGVFSK